MTIYLRFGSFLYLCLATWSFSLAIPGVLGVHLSREQGWVWDREGDPF